MQTLFSIPYATVAIVPHTAYDSCASYGVKVRHRVQEGSFAALSNPTTPGSGVPVQGRFKCLPRLGRLRVNRTTYILCATRG